MRSDLNTLRADLETIPGFQLLQKINTGMPLYLVGGVLRDWALGRSSKDIDLATPGDPTGFAQEFASRCGGSWFWLDESRQHSRVVLQQTGTSISYDFGPLRANTIEEDLKLRDFTLNALAVEITSATLRLHDPLSALTDLANGVLRQCGTGSFAADPLRVLRGVRFVQQLGVRPETETWANMATHAPDLSRVAGERIQAELASLLHFQGDNDFLPEMLQLGLFQELFGFMPDAEKLNRVFLHFDTAVKKVSPWLAGLLEGMLANGFSHRALLKLHLLLEADSGTNSRNNITLRLRLGRRCSRALDGLAGLRRCGYFPLPESPRAQQLWYEDLPGIPRTSLAALCLGRPVGLSHGIDPARFHPRLMTEGDRSPLPALVVADELIELLGFSPGPEIGAALAALRRAEIEEQVATQSEAREFLRQWQRRSRNSH